MANRFHPHVFAAVLGFVAGLIAGALFLGIGRVAGLPEEASGLMGPAAIIGLRLAAALTGVVPSSPVLVAAGASEGIFLGSVYVLIGAELGALIGFLVGRHLGRDFVERRGWLEAAAKTRLGHRLLDAQTPQWQLMAAVFLCRLVPGLNLDALSYVAGLTPLTAWRFCLASFAALVPYTVLLVAAGQHLVRFGPGVLGAVLLGLMALGAVPLMRRKRGARTNAGP